MLKIFDVIDTDGKQIAVEITDGAETWFYYMDQSVMPSMRMGKVPRKNLDEEFERVLLVQYAVKNHPELGSDIEATELEYVADGKHCSNCDVNGIYDGCCMNCGTPENIQQGSDDAGDVAVAPV